MGMVCEHLLSEGKRREEGIYGTCNNPACPDCQKACKFLLLTDCPHGKPRDITLDGADIRELQKVLEELRRAILAPDGVGDNDTEYIYPTLAFVVASTAGDQLRLADDFGAVCRRAKDSGMNITGMITGGNAPKDCYDGDNDMLAIELLRQHRHGAGSETNTRQDNIPTGIRQRKQDHRGGGMRIKGKLPPNLRKLTDGERGL